ncbi:MAG: DNA helicase RecQ, partial [Planctomycetes bacterium]|nr:DNA helicase RecQ [Planctomycetota bacterium]
METVPISSSPTDLVAVSEALRKYWGFDSYRPLQEPAIRCVLNDRDSIVVLPTGGGKSLCFQAPAVCRGGLAVVVSPLISLMKDQVDALTSCGVPAAYTNSSLSIEERRDVADRVRRGELRLLYMAPERLVTEQTIDFLKASDVSFFAIDEAHCISEWGHDFRPEYRRLKMLKETFPGIAVHAYTATATDRVRQDIARNLGLEEPEILVGSFDRPNLIYQVRQRDDAIRQLQEVLDRHPGDSGIIYCIRRDDVDTTAAALSQLGYRALPYHAGMNPADRKRNQEAFITEKTDVIVATVAFGMGIDKSNVRFVIHAAMPKSLENYQQESGRAGRDGLEAECCLFFSSGDFALWKRMLSDLNGDAYEAALQSLNGISAYCTAVCCRHRSLVQHFGEAYDKDSCDACDVCLGDLDLVDDALVIGQKILSCVVRLEQRFGGDYTSLVLAGSQEKRILEQRHDQLSTWGLLQDENRRNVRDWIEQLVGQKFLEKTGEYNVLQVTAEGRRLLRGDVTPQLLKPKAVAKKSSRKSAGGVSADSWEGVDEGLFEHLRTIRREKAAELEVPAYVVFSDAALREMARLRPTTLAAFINVKGVGEKKRDDYGQEFVDEIGRYCRDHDLPTDVTASEAPTKPRAPRTLSKSAIVSFSHFEQGKSIADVAAQMGRAVSTVSGYLSDFIAHQNVR